MKLSVKEFRAMLEAVGPHGAKALCKMDDLEVVDDEGKPVQIEAIHLSSGKGEEVEIPVDETPVPAEPVPGEEEDELAGKGAGKCDGMDDEEKYGKALRPLVEKAVKEALAANAKGTGRARIAAPLAATAKAAYEMEVKGVAGTALRRHTGHLKNFHGDVNGRSAKERAFRFGHFCLALAHRQLPGRFNFGKSVDFVSNYITKLQNEYNNAQGGVLVPEEFGTDMIDLREQYGVGRRLLKRRTMSSDTRTDPRRTGGLTAYGVAEGAAGTESTKTWDQVRLVAKDWMVLTRYTSQLSEDAVIDIGDDLAGEIAYAFANKEDECIFNGTGTSTYQGIVGIRTKLQDVDGAGTDGSGLVTGTGNAWSELTLADFHNVISKLPQYADTGNVAWVAHRTFFFSVMHRLELAAGGVTSAEVRDGQRQYRFLGYPVEISQVFPSAEANSQVCAILGDYTLGGSFGDRQQDAIAFSEHATIGGESVFERNEIAVRGHSRWDVNIHDVGTSAVNGPIVGLQTAGS